MKDENTTIVALLHDVIEYTDYTIDDLKKMKFDDDVIFVSALSYISLSMTLVRSKSLRSNNCNEMLAFSFMGNLLSILTF